jgi:mercuric ion transport protein
MKSLHLEKVGVAGSIFAVLCCLGFGPVLAVLSAVGADSSSTIRFWRRCCWRSSRSVWLSFRQHHRWTALVVHVVSSITVFLFTFIAFNRMLISFGIAGLIAAAATDLFLRRHPHNKRATSAT